MLVSAYITFTSFPGTDFMCEDYSRNTVEREHTVKEQQPLCRWKRGNKMPPMKKTPVTARNMINSPINLQQCTFSQFIYEAAAVLDSTMTMRTLHE